MKTTNFFRIGLLVALGFSIAAFNACKDNTPPKPVKPDNSQANALVGTWKYIQSFERRDGNTKETTDPKREQEMAFYANGKLYSIVDGEGTYSASGNDLSTITTKNAVTKEIAAGKVVILDEASLFVRSYTFDIKNDTLRIVTDAKVTASGQAYFSIYTEVYVKIDNGSTIVTDISLNKSTLSLAVAEEYSLIATTEPDNSDIEIKWSSSNTNVATVVNGKVKAIAVGTTTITAQAGSKSATCAVTVTATKTVDPATITISSTPQFAAVINGVTQHKIDGAGVYNGTPFYSGAARYYQSNFEDAAGKDYLRITRGGLKYASSTVPFEIFNAFFEKGSYNYYNLSSDGTGDLNGIEIQWTDSNGVEWSTSKGTGIQTGSTCTITDVLATGKNAAGNFTKVKVRILFSCTLYDASGNSMKVEQGVFVGEFMNH